MAERRVVANEPAIVHETLDGELVVVHVASGTYFSGGGPATVAWNELVSGATTGEVAALLSEAYDVDVAQAALDLEDFVADLESQGLVRPLADATGEGDTSPSGTSVPGTGAYVAPRLKRYDDLVDLAPPSPDDGGLGPSPRDS